MDAAVCEPLLTHGQPRSLSQTRPALHRQLGHSQRQVRNSVFSEEASSLAVRDGANLYSPGVAL